MSQNQDYPSVAVVILNYNGEHFLRKFLGAVYASVYPNWKLYVADNASTDSSTHFLKQEGFVAPNQATPVGELPKFLIELPENYGFAEGYNQALKQVDADYYVLLNSDVEVDKNWVMPIIELMENDPQVAACQPKVKMMGQKHLFEHAGAAGGWIDRWGYPFCRGRVFMEIEEDKGQYDDVQEVFWASGAAMFIRAELFHAFGGFDGDFFAHMEEIDLCWRLKKANYKIMVQPKSSVWHVGGGTLPVTSPRKAFLNFRNSLITLAKNQQGWVVLWIIWVRLILDGVAAIRFLTKGEFKHIWAIVRAHWQFFWHFPKHWRKRKKVQQLVAKNAYPEAHDENIGRLPQSIVKAYFLDKKKTFSELLDKELQ